MQTSPHLELRQVWFQRVSNLSTSDLFQFWVDKRVNSLRNDSGVPPVEDYVSFLYLKLDELGTGNKTQLTKLNFEVLF